MLLPCVMHQNPNEPHKHIVSAGFVQLLCTCAAATHWHLCVAAMHYALQPKRTNQA